MATIYFLGSSPRHESRIYLIARINSQFSSISRSFLSPTKLNFVGTPLDLVVRRTYKKRTRIKRVHQVDGNYLFSRVVSNQISSTCKSLTFVFGMGTSGTSQLLSPSWYIEHQFSLIQNNDSCILRTFDFLANCYAIIAFLVNVLRLMKDNQWFSFITSFPFIII